MSNLLQQINITHNNKTQPGGFSLLGYTRFYCSSIAMNMIDWTDVTVETMADNALARCSIETLILKAVTFGGGHPFSGLDRIARIQVSYRHCTL